MPNYKAPLRDMQFVYHELLAAENIDQLPGMEDFSPDIINAVLEEASKICEELLFPLNRTGDEEGCHFDQGKVTVPKGFDEAYQQYKEAGWPSLMASPDFGGQGFPHTFYMLFGEMLCSSNLSFAMYPELTYGACNAISRFGSPEIQQKFMPKMIEGEWSGTMCLTEPHCGTDLAQIRTRAGAGENDNYRITGSKIFISAGEHELTRNIIHLVLARAPDAPEGIRGISLFLVPKYKINDDGSVGDNNGVECGSIEHKMGIKASSTCTINFDNATGYLIGKLHKGMEAMFVMMNSARLGVGLQGVGLAEIAYQNAVEYANERLQGRALTGVKMPDKAADPIIVHPDVRRMLLTMRAYTEGARAMGSWIATYHDKELKSTGQEKIDAEEMVALMTPTIKAFFTDIAFEVTNMGMQVFGGHGYIRENGMEQYARDARITQIYEGTNGIQALDLVGRKLPQRMGRYLRHFFHPVQKYIDQQLNNPELNELATPLDKAFGRLQRATGFIAQQGMKNPDEAGAAASDYLRLFGLVSMGYIWLRMAEIAVQNLENGDDDFYQAKLDTATFYMERLLPQNSALFANIMSGSKTMMSFKTAAF